MKISKNKIFNILLIVLFVAPQINEIYFISIILLSLISTKFSNYLTENFKSFFLLIFIVLLSFSISSIRMEFLPHIKDILKTLILIFLIFISSVNHTKFEINKYTIYFIFSFLILSQISYVLGIEKITNFLDNLYPLNEDQKIWTHRSIYDLNSIKNFTIRAGGIYRNPNQFGKYINLLLLIILHNNKLKKHFKNYIAFILLIPIISTGSRSAFLIYLISIATYYSIKERNRIVIISILIGMLFILKNFSIRSINIIDSFSGGGSLTYRKVGLNFILYNNNILNYLIGNFYNENTLNVIENSKIMFDSDAISMLFSYGVIGSFLIYLHYFKLVRKNQQKYMYIIFLYSITSGVFFDINFIMIITTLIIFYKNEYSYTKI